MTRAPRMPLSDASSIARTLHAARGGRITRACSMPGRRTQLVRRALDEHAARLGGRASQQPRAIGHAGAARSATLVAGAGGIAHHHFDLVEADIELFGDDLRHGDIEALAHVHLAEE